MGISTTSQPRAKRKLDRTQPQEKGRHRSCAAPNGASAECQSQTTGSRPWLKLYRRYAAKMANLQTTGSRPWLKLYRRYAASAVTDGAYKGFLTFMNFSRSLAAVLLISSVWGCTAQTAAPPPSSGI